MEWRRASSLGRASLLCGTVSVLCACNVAAGAGIGMAMVGQGLVHHWGWRRATERRSSAGAQRSGRSLMEMSSTNKKTKWRKLGSTTQIWLVWDFFLWGMCFRHPLTLILETYWGIITNKSPFVRLCPDKIGLVLLFPHGSGNHCSRILALSWHCVLYSVCSCSNAAVTFSPHLLTCTEH